MLLPASDASSGIWTLNLGRGAPSRRLLDLEGGVKEVSGMVGTEFLALARFAALGLCERGGDESAFVRETDPTSTDCARFPLAPTSSLRPEAKEAKC